MDCNVKIGNQQYYASSVNKYIIENNEIIPIIALIVGSLTLLYVLYKASDDRSLLLIIPFLAGVVCLVFGSIYVDNYREAVSKTKEEGKNCKPI